MELLPEVLVFLGDGCDHLGYPAQLRLYGHQALDELGEENNGDGFDGEGSPLRIWAEVLEILVAEPEGTPLLSELPHHELDGVVGRGCSRTRREVGVKGRKPTEGLVPWGEIIGVCHSCEQARKGARGV